MALVVVLVAVAAVATAALSGAAAGWLLGILAAGLAGALSAAIPRWVEHARAETSAPLATTVQVLDAELVATERSLAPASGHTVRIAVQALGATTLLLGLRVTVVSRAAVTGQLLPQFGSVDPRPFEVLLDADPPVVRPASTPEGRGPDFPFKVSNDDPEVFDLTAHTEAGEVLWVLDLDWSCRGRTGSTRIDLDGQPFRTVARPRDRAGGTTPESV